jgi:hypothetical protein
MFALIGQGTNDLEIPAMFFSSKEAALTKCQEIFGTEGRVRKDGSLSWKIGEDKDGYAIVNRMYTSYYDGCGGCYDAKLIEIADGTPFVSWNLD